MHKHFVVNIVARLLLVVCFFMAIPLGLAAYDDLHGRETIAFSAAIVFGVVLAFCALGVFRIKKEDYKRINAKDGLAIVGLSWIGLSLFGALPLYLSGVVSSYTDAFFEIVSGFTTTGASIFTDVEVLPRGILFWRALTNWLGGIGIVVLFIAVLPALGMNTAQIYQAETSGIAFDKIEPRIKETARNLLVIYLILTAVEVVLLAVGKMPIFDALCHSFATIATGGFSTKNTSIGGYGSYIQWVVIIFMFLGGANFALHYEALRGRWGAYSKDEEFRFYFYVMLALTAVSALVLAMSGLTAAPLRDAAFSLASIFSSTGFATADYDKWPDSLRLFLLVGMITGACAGSTSGGLKMIRLFLTGKVACTSVVQAAYPNAVIPLKFNGQPLENKTVSDIVTFFAVYLYIWFAGAILFAFWEGCDIPTAISAAAACLSNVGPGLNRVGAVQNYAWISIPGKWLLSFLMLAGRLELYAILVLFIPSTWKK